MVSMLRRCDRVTTGELMELFVACWGHGEKWVSLADRQGPHEANFLKLDCTKVKAAFGRKPTWHIDKSIETTCAWTRVWLDGGDIPAEMDREIRTFVEA